MKKTESSCTFHDLRGGTILYKSLPDLFSLAGVPRIYNITCRIKQEQELGFGSNGVVVFWWWLGKRFGDMLVLLFGVIFVIIWICKAVWWCWFETNNILTCSWNQSFYMADISVPQFSCTPVIAGARWCLTIRQIRSE